MLADRKRRVYRVQLDDLAFGSLLHHAVRRRDKAIPGGAVRRTWTRIVDELRNANVTAVPVVEEGTRQ